MPLSKLTPAIGSRKPAKRVGRGTGNGHGKTSCRGHNGDGSRSGSRRKRGFEGGQMPLQRRLPKRGFFNIFKKIYVPINLGDINLHVGIEKEVDAQVLVKLGLLRSNDLPIKVLGNGDFEKAITIKANAFSKNAIEKIEKVGGKAEKC